MMDEFTAKAVLGFAAFCWCLWIFVAPRFMKIQLIATSEDESK